MKSRPQASRRWARSHRRCGPVKFVQQGFPAFLVPPESHLIGIQRDLLDQGQHQLCLGLVDEHAPHIIQPLHGGHGEVSVESELAVVLTQQFFQ